MTKERHRLSLSLVFSGTSVFAFSLLFLINLIKLSALFHSDTSISPYRIKLIATFPHSLQLSLFFHSTFLTGIHPWHFQFEHFASHPSHITFKSRRWHRSIRFGHHHLRKKCVRVIGYRTEIERQHTYELWANFRQFFSHIYKFSVRRYSLCQTSFTIFTIFSTWLRPARWHSFFCISLNSHFTIGAKTIEFYAWDEETYV